MLCGVVRYATGGSGLAVVGGDDQLAGLDLVDDGVDLLGHLGGHLVAERSHADHAIVEAGEGLAAVAPALIRSIWEEIMPEISMSMEVRHRPSATRVD